MDKPGNAFGRREWQQDEKDTVQSLLEAKIPGEHISTRPGAGGAKVSYIESWKAIELANAIFGFNGWSSTIVDITPDFVEPEAGKWKVGVTAIVKVTLKDGTFHEDVGYGMHENKSKGTAIENAKKEAVSDARKRALRVFGNALGNSIYDRVYTAQETKGKVKSTIPQGPVSYAGVRVKVEASSSDENEHQHHGTSNPLSESPMRSSPSVNMINNPNPPMGIAHDSKPMAENGGSKESSPQRPNFPTSSPTQYQTPPNAFTSRMPMTRNNITASPQQMTSSPVTAASMQQMTSSPSCPVVAAPIGVVTTAPAQPQQFSSGYNDDDIDYAALMSIEESVTRQPVKPEMDPMREAQVNELIGDMDFDDHSFVV